MAASTPPTAWRRRPLALGLAGLAGLATATLGLATWTGIASGEAAASPGQGLTTSHAGWSPDVGSYGISLGADVTFDEDRVLTRGRILVETVGPAPYVSFTPRDGTDEDAGYRLPRSIDSGMTVAAEVTVRPTCGVEVTTAPAFEIDSRPDDGLLTAVHMVLSDPRTDSVPAADLSSWKRAVQEWCAMGVQAHLSEGTTTLDGGVSQTLTLYNPGPDPVTVVCDADSGWEHSEVTVPGGGTGELTVHGDQPDLDQAPPLTANGRPVRVLG